MLLTFIIPLYNCEKYIVRCLNSIYSCGLEDSDFEVVVVNDGSEDEGAEIVSEFARTKNNLTLLNFNNRGTATARNEGLKVAKSEWIWFVDADDEICKDAAKIAFADVDNSIDAICFCGAKGIIPGIQYLKESNGRLYVWDKIFRNAAIANYRFLDGLRNLEDMLFCYTVMLSMENIKCISEMLYVYNSDNVHSTSRNKTKRNLVKNSMDSQITLETIQKMILSENIARKKSVLQNAFNFTMAGYLYSLMVYYSPLYMCRQLKKMSLNGWYPAMRSNNRKANIFINIVGNNKSLLLVCCWLCGLKNRMRTIA